MPDGWLLWLEEAKGDLSAHDPLPAVILTKTASMLVEDVEFGPRGPTGEVLSALGGVAATTNIVIDAFKQQYGGLWVGGRVTLTTAALEFRANALNRAVQSGTLDVAVPLGEIGAVNVLPGFVTKIIAVDVGFSRLKLRCYGAAGVADAIERARARQP